MMKRRICWILCLALLLGLAVPAAAAEAQADARLAQVTQAVKETLGLRTEDYDTFQGDCYEQELAQVWTLRWEGGGGSLYVEALEDGTVLSYRLNEPAGQSGTGLPSFPTGDPQAAKTAAQAFLQKVLDPASESVVLGEPEGQDRLESAGYYFSGEILLHGRPSPLQWSMTVGMEDNRVLRFRRDVPETCWLGGIPAASAAVSQADAAGKLRTTQSLRLEYVLPEDGGREAVLRYVPDWGHEFYVDAQSGALVDLTALRDDMYSEGGAKNDAAADLPAAAEAAPAGGMTAAEEAGIAQLEGVLSQQALDEKLRAVGEFGLDRFTLLSAAYSRESGRVEPLPVSAAVGQPEKSEERIVCTLRYSRAAGGDVYRRTATVDARTGEVLSLWSSNPWVENYRPALSKAQAQAKAEAFLAARYGAHNARLALYEAPDDLAGGSGQSYRFTFARRENGCFFPANAYTVSVDAGDGSVCGLNWTYDEDVTFASPDGIVTGEAAMDAWMDTYQVTLAYLAVPAPLTGSSDTVRRLKEAGMKAFYTLKLGYALKRETYVSGIDARTGQPVSGESAAPAAPAYADTASHWAKAEIERLSRYGVGYAAETFQPNRNATQLDLVCLLASLRGYRLDPAAAGDEEKDEAYAIAYEMGALTWQERQDAAALRRSDAVRILLNAAGYGPAAKLQGIYTCAYRDRASIPAAELGYAALAQGLGLLQNEYAGTRPATRAQLAVMLSRLMSR